MRGPRLDGHAAELNLGGRRSLGQGYATSKCAPYFCGLGPWIVGRHLHSGARAVRRHLVFATALGGLCSPADQSAAAPFFACRLSYRVSYLRPSLRFILRRVRHWPSCSNTWPRSRQSRSSHRRSGTGINSACKQLTNSSLRKRALMQPCGRAELHDFGLSTGPCQTCEKDITGRVSDFAQTGTRQSGACSAARGALSRRVAMSQTGQSRQYAEERDPPRRWVSSPWKFSPPARRASITSST